LEDTEKVEFKFDNMSEMAKRVVYVSVFGCIFLILLGYSYDPAVLGAQYAKFFIALGIGWFITGPVCWGWAWNKDRNEDFAFIWGLFLGIPGAVLYWIYSLFFKSGVE
jgi:hypothetical protein